MNASKVACGYCHGTGRDPSEPLEYRMGSSCQYCLGKGFIWHKSEADLIRDGEEREAQAALLNSPCCGKPRKQCDCDPLDAPRIKGC